MQLSAAFIKGAQFAIGANQLAQDAKAKKDEEIHWRTIGEGEEAHAVPIAGPDPKAKKAESKKAAEAKKPESKKTEGKAAQPKKAETKDKKATAGKLKYNINDTRKALRDGVNASHVSRADEIKWNDARRQMGEAIKATKTQENAMINLIDGALEDEELTTAQAKKLKDKLKDVQKDMPELIKQAEDAIEAVKNNLMNDRDLEGKIESLDNAARRALKINSAVVHVGSDLRQYKSETAQKRQEEIAQRMQRENLGSNNTESKKAAEPKKAEKKPAKIELGTTYEIANGQPFTKESLDTIKSYFGSLDGNNDELSDDSSDQMSIWYSNGKFEVFTPESDPAELARALNKKGIKMVVWDNGYGTTYCGSEKALQLRNPDTNEVKTLDELRREDLNPDSLWIVDDVVGRKEAR